MAVTRRMVLTCCALGLVAPVQAALIEEWECTSYSGWSRDDSWGQFFQYTDTRGDSIFSWGWWNSQAIRRGTGEVFEADTVYTLTVLARKGDEGAWGVGLEFADTTGGWTSLAGQSHAFQSSAFGVDTPWEEFTFSFDTTHNPALVGREIGIAIRNENNGGAGWIHVNRISFGTGEGIAAQAITINPANTMQRFEHWGTSLCWWAHGIGDWTNTIKRELLLDLIFDQSFGLGLTFVRYNIGGGDNPAYNFLRPGGDVPGYQPQPGVWDWSADPYQRYVLDSAIARGATSIDAFSNSPPWWMTISGSSTGAVGGGNNLRPEMYDDFADYIARVSRHLMDTHEIEFDMIIPLNEPMGTWWQFGGWQEGCHFDRPEQNTLIIETGKALLRYGIFGRRVGAPEETSVNSTLASINSYTSEAKSYIGAYNTHTYGGSDREGLRDAAADDGIPLIMSEYGNGTTNNFESMFVTAQQIARDINRMQVPTWTYWQVVEAADVGEVAERWGMITARFNGPEDFTVFPKYYGFKQFTASIRPGTMIIHPGAGREDRLLIGLHPVTGKLIVVAINPFNGVDQLSLDLSALPFAIANADRIRTSLTQNYAILSPLSITDALLVDTLPGKSITTYTVDTLPNLDQRWLATTLEEGWSTAGAEMTETDPGVHKRTLNLGSPPTSHAPWHVEHTVLPALSYPLTTIDAWYKHATASTLELCVDENERGDGWLPDGAILYQDPPYLTDTYVAVGSFQNALGETNWNAASTLTLLRDDGQHGDAVAGDNIWTLRLTIPTPGAYEALVLADRDWNTRYSTVGPISDPHNNFRFVVDTADQTVTFHCDPVLSRITVTPRNVKDWRGVLLSLAGPDTLPASDAPYSPQDLLDRYDLGDDNDVDVADVAALMLVQ